MAAEIATIESWAGGIRTHVCQSQSLMPYRLATSQYRCDSLWPDTLGIIAWNARFGNPFFHFFGFGFLPHGKRNDKLVFERLRRIDN